MITTHMEEEDHFTQTLLPLLSHYCTRQQASLSLLVSHILHSLTFWSLTYASIYWHEWCHNSSSSSTKVAANSSSFSTMVAANLWHLRWVHMVGATPVVGSWQWQPSPRVGLLQYKWQYPKNHPLCHLCGATVLLLLQHRLVSCSSSKLTILRVSPAKFTGTFHTFQSPESLKHTFSHTKRSLQQDSLSLHIWRVLTLVSGIQHSPLSISTMLGPEWFIKPYTKAYNTPSNRNFHFQVRQSLSEYLNMIMSSPLFQESTHPGVASSVSP